MMLASPVVIPPVTRELRRFWSFYRRYAETAVHTAAASALAIFGILVFVDPWFAAVAIACYVVPPVALYAIGAEPPSPEDAPNSSGDRTREGETGAARDRTVEPVASTPTPEPGRSRRGGGSDTDTDTDTDSDDGDTDSDSDSDDGDTDSDSDSDSDDGDTDTDSDSDS